jgi:hypothetical protein
VFCPLKRLMRVNVLILTLTLTLALFCFRKLGKLIDSAIRIHRKLWEFTDPWKIVVTFLVSVSTSSVIVFPLHSKSDFFLYFY